MQHPVFTPERPWFIRTSPALLWELSKFPKAVLMRPTVYGVLPMQMRWPQSNLAHSRNQRRIPEGGQCISKGPDPSRFCRSFPDAQGILGSSSQPPSLAKDNRASDSRSKPVRHFSASETALLLQLLCPSLFPCLFPALGSWTRIIRIFENRYYLKDILKQPHFWMINPHHSWLCPEAAGKAKKLQKSISSLSFLPDCIYTLPLTRGLLWDRRLNKFIPTS